MGRYNAGRNSAELTALTAGGPLVSAIGIRAALLVAGLVPLAIALAGLRAVRRDGGRAQASRSASEAAPSTTLNGRSSVTVS